jgi:hypothetical protein
LLLEGLGGAGAMVGIRNAAIAGHPQDGVHVNLTNTGPSVTVTGSQISGNGTDGAADRGGVVVLSAPSGTASDAVTLDGLDIHDNGAGASGFGVLLAGSAGDVTATIRHSTIHDNRDQGIRVARTGAHSTRAAITDNDVHTNNTGAARQVGGILFATPSTLTAFTGNRIHDNGRDELGFDAPPATGATWVIATPGCGPDHNAITCYGPGDFGLRVSAATTVDARGTTWAHPAPSAATNDVSAVQGSTVEAGAACPPITTCP